MRRLFVAVIVFAHALWCASSVQTQNATAPYDPIADTLTRLQSAVAANTPADFRALCSSALSADDADSFAKTMFGTDITNAALRVRDREPVAGGVQVLAEVLVDRNGSGLVATWQLTLAPAPTPAAATDQAAPPTTAPPAAVIAGLKLISSVAGLRRLELDTSAAYAVNNFTFTATDFRLTMTEGVAFSAKTEEGVTALVLRGKGTMTFEPFDPVERHQLVRLNGKETLTESVSAAFLRIHPSDLRTRLGDSALMPMDVRPGDVGRAKQIFSQWSPRSYSVDLGDLSTAHWSLVPNPGDAVADLDTGDRGWLTYGRSASSPEDVSLIDRTNHKNLSLYASPAKLASRGRFYSEDTDRIFDVEHYDVSATVAPDKGLIAGTTTMRVKLLHHDTGTLTLKLAEPLAVTSLTSPEFGRLLYFRVIGQDSLLVSLPELQPAGKTFSLTVSYNGRLPPQSMTREAIAVAPDPQQTQSSQQDNAIPAEPSYLYSVNTYWYPQPTVTDYATARMRITVPSEFEVSASGTTLDDQAAGDTRTVTFGADPPARYLSILMSRMLALPRTTIALPDGRTMLLDAHASPRQIGGTRTLAQRAAEIIKFYAKYLGDAPYPSLNLTAVEAEIPGGHSPAYLVALNQPLATTIFSWRQDPVAFDDQFPNFYLAHEIAHQWWGQAVGTKNYHEQWLSEGLAQYFAYLYAGEDRGPNVQRNILDRMRASVRRYDDSGPISLGYRLGHAVGSGLNFRAIVYNKSAVVLDMLRRLIGDEPFAAGLRRFYRDRRFDKAGTDDLRTAFEAEAHQDLTRFFDRWVLSSGLPDIRLTSAVVTGAGTTAALRLEQVGEVYDVPVEIAVAYEKLPAEVVQVTLRAAVTEASIPLKGPVRKDGIRLLPVF